MTKKKYLIPALAVVDMHQRSVFCISTGNSNGTADGFDFDNQYDELN